MIFRRHLQLLTSSTQFGVPRSLITDVERRLIQLGGLRGLSDAALNEIDDLESAVGGGHSHGSVPLEEQLVTQVGVVGVPNAGKSTLTNALVGQKVSAVSDKTNTTVRSRLGAFTSGNAQVVLFDTPGVVGKEDLRNLPQIERVQSAWKVASGCNVLLFVVDAQRQLLSPDPRVLRTAAELVAPENEEDPLTITAAQLRHGLPPVALVLNKVDAVPKEERPYLLKLADDFQNVAPFQDVFWVSALRGQGIEDLRTHLLARAAPGHWTLDAGVGTDVSEQDVAVEIVREKIFRSYYKEIPYEIEIVPMVFKTLMDQSIRIEMDVVVANENVKKIVVGRRGVAISSVGKGARLELERMWNKRVHLFLNLKIK